MTQRTNKIFFAISSCLAVLFISGSAFAQGAAPLSAEAAKFGASGWIGLSAAIAIGLAVIGGAMGQGKAAAAALEGIARNPASAGKIFTPMILGLALVESLVIFALLIAFQLVGKI